MKKKRFQVSSESSYSERDSAMKAELEDEFGVSTHTGLEAMLRERILASIGVDRFRTEFEQSVLLAIRFGHKIKTLQLKYNL